MSSIPIPNSTHHNLLTDSNEGLDYTQFYTKLIAMSDTLKVLIDECEKIMNKLTEHNSSGIAHPDIRNLFSEDLINEMELEERLKIHDFDPDSHKVLKDALLAIIYDTTIMDKAIADAIYAHDKGGVSHISIRSLISTLYDRIGNIDFITLREEVDTLITDVGAHLQARLLQIENTNILQDRVDDDLSRQMTFLSSQMEELDEVVHSLNSIGITRESVHKSNLLLYTLDMNERLGYRQYDIAAPDMMGYTHTLPMYLGINHECEFTISGVVSSMGNSDEVKYTIDVGTSKAIVYPTENISNGDTIRITTNTDATGGEIRHLVVTATDTVSDVPIRRCLAYYVAVPFEVHDASLVGLPNRVEPGNKYICHIQNSKETGDRFTYTFDDLDTEVLLTHATNSQIATHEQLTLHIPSEVERGSTITVRVHVHDKYNSAFEGYFDVDVAINIVPNLEELDTNVPLTVIPGVSMYVYFANVTDIMDEYIYDIKEPHEYLTFEKTEGIKAHEQVKMTISPDALRGDKASFKLFVTDVYGGHLSTELFMDINILPSADNISAVVPTAVDGGTTIQLQIADGSDEDGRVVSYSLECSEGISPAKTHSIQAYEDIFVYIGKVDVLTTKYIDIYAKDNLGEKSIVPKRYEIEVAPVYALTKPIILNMHNGDVLDVGFTVVISDIGMEIDAPPISEATPSQL